MPNKQIVVKSFPSLPSVSLQIFPAGLGASIETQTPLADTDDGSLYVATFTTLSEIRYRWNLYSEGELVTDGFVTIGEGTGPHFDEDMLTISFSDDSAGTGARTITVTVTDGTDPLEGCTVRLSEGVMTAVQTTNSQGVAVLAVDDATYAVAVTKSGYSGVTTSLVVDGDESASIELDAVITVAPSPPDTATGVMLLTQHGVVAQGTEVSAQLIAGTGTSGTGQVNPVWTQLSDQDGLVQFSGLAWGSRYRFWLGCRTDESVEMDVPSVEQVNLPNLIGD